MEPQSRASDLQPTPLVSGRQVAAMVAGPRSAAAGPLLLRHSPAGPLRRQSRRRGDTASPLCGESLPPAREPRPEGPAGRDLCAVTPNVHAGLWGSTFTSRLRLQFPRSCGWKRLICVILLPQGLARRGAGNRGLKVRKAEDTGFEPGNLLICSRMLYPPQSPAPELHPWPGTGVQ